MNNVYQKLILISTTLFLCFSSSAQTGCANASNIYTFTYNGSTYEVVKENKTWTDAATCAVERGGFLAEINDSTEQVAVYTEVLSNAGITASNTVAPDGGGASYVWIGGNDLSVEGEWTWDGDNDGSGSQFWQGTSSGSPVGGLYNNWGNEPDDFGGQDGLGLAITNWPLGVSGEWNDVDDANTLYYVIEYPSTVGVIWEPGAHIDIYPNPSIGGVFTLNSTAPMKTIIVFNMKGAQLLIKEIDLSAIYELDLSDLKEGTYFVQIVLENDEKVNRKIIR